MQKQKNGIWQFDHDLAPVVESCRLSLAEANTDLIRAEADLYVKCDFQNPTGSLKDRGMAYLISWCLENNHHRAVLSSSGNAAISAAAYCQLAGIELTVFVSPQIHPGKLRRLQESAVQLSFSKTPIKDALVFSKTNGAFYLRPSLLLAGREGYQTLAFEIAKQLPAIDDLFLPVSSGASLVGIYEGFLKTGRVPRFHLCQPASRCYLAGRFDSVYPPEKHSLADALVARYTPLQAKILEIIRSTSGSGWVIANSQIVTAGSTIQLRLDTSSEGLLALAAYYKAKESKRPPGRSVVLFSGKSYAV